METARWQRLNELFHGAVGHAAEERRAWLERACAGDHALVAEVERLVRAHDRASAVIRTDDVPNAIRLLAGPAQVPSGRGFAGTERFTVGRTLGVGGMGVVYEVHDRVRDEIVALKTFLRAQPAEIYRLKREFRSLADVAHVNLVSLYELFVESDRCFFTMELVNGANFVDAVRVHGTSPTDALSSARTTMAAADVTADVLRGHPTSAPPSAATPDLDRLRLVFEQLIHGVSELHRRGKLHRDIKPSNVLVTPEGRVVILDFGLIAELSSGQAGQGERIAGTPAYMSPEQATGGAASEASDWYSVGVTLYEALTGRVPFPGTFQQVLGPKTKLDPPAPAELMSGVPHDLSDVCMGLLCRNPERRLSGVEALRRLGHRGATISAPAHGQNASFVGREWQLKVLRESFEEVRGGRAAAVYVCGPSGIGKSALIAHFLDRVVAPERAIVLTGRCYENESVPYKALDGVVDSLSHCLASLPPSSVEALMPDDSSALARVFPVLLRVDALASTARVTYDTDPLLLRRRAFAALRELLGRVSQLQPLVISIDDLHWADADSAVLIEELLRPPQAPALMMLACFRTEEMANKPFLRTLLQGSGTITPLPLAPMTDEEGCELIGSLIPAESSVSRDEMLSIVREAEGNPFVVEQLARYTAQHRGATRDEPTLSEMLDDRLRGLPEGAPRFLDTLAICGRPMPPSLVHEASDLSGDKRSLVAVLRSTNFVRSSGSGERVEIYHDRIRDALAARMNPEDVRRVHRRVAHTLVARGIDDPEALFEHCRAAGDYEQASMHAGIAAEKASTVLAFDRAVLFYRHALELAPDPERHPEWKTGLAAALGNVGRPAEAAAIYLDAAEDAAGSRRLELQRRGAHQFLVGGHFDRGIEVMRMVLSAARMRFPRYLHSALASLAIRRAQLWWRGLNFLERDAGQIPADVLLRIDACWSVATGMAMVDPIRGFDFHTRHLLLALEAGEPYRVARGLAVEAAFRSTRGGAPGRYTEFITRAEHLSQRIGHPHAIALSAMAAGMAAMFTEQWKRGEMLCHRALTLLRGTRADVTWELNVAEGFFLGALLYQGKLQETAGALATALATAKDCGNLYLEAEIRTRMMTIMLLRADDPVEADRQADEVMQRWWSGGFTRQHYNHVLGRGITALYRGDGDAAWQIVVENRPAVRRARLLNIQVVRVEMSSLRGRSALAAATGSTSGRKGAAARRRFMSVARREARTLAREQTLRSEGYSLLLSAAVAYLDGEGRVAEERLARAVDAFEGADMPLQAAAARRRLGALQGSRGRALVGEAEEWMASQAIKNPRCMSRMIAPGFEDI